MNSPQSQEALQRLPDDDLAASLVARPHPESDRLDDAIAEAVDALKSRQADDGHWVFELEADATIPAEYILLEHFLDWIDPETEDRLAAYLRSIQHNDGGWPLFHDGDTDLSATVKAYFALKLAGDDPDDLHMVRARQTILNMGGAAQCNVFTRITLALFGQVPWRAVPTMPVEIMLLPEWSPFHLSKISYWSRTVLVPLLVLMDKKPTAVNPRNVSIAELFATPPFEEKHYLHNPTGAMLGRVFLAIDHVLRVATPRLPGAAKKRAIDRAMNFVTERLNGEDGLGGIFPAMANAAMAYRTLGYSDDDPNYRTALMAIRKLLVQNDEGGYCQPCLSPVWDTALSLHALMEAGERIDSPTVQSATSWLERTQITEIKGDWAWKRPDLAPGGWAFQYQNDHYPDTDDSAVVMMALDRAGTDRTGDTMQRGLDWIVGMQSENGGWGSFDADNTFYYLNHIPFADHGALLDPPTADVSARCLGMLAQLGRTPDDPVVARAIDYLKSEQEDDGSWFGRWGTNYVYGTWSVLCAMNAIGVDPDEPFIQKAVAWLKSRQRDDGGWGEDGASYWEERRDEAKASTPSQTAWALLGLMAAGEVDTPEVERGIEYLLDAPRQGGRWDEKYYNAVGFPKVFYLSYHGYSRYFPLWALARYRHLRDGNAATTPYGM